MKTCPTPQPAARPFLAAPATTRTRARCRRTGGFALLLAACLFALPAGAETVYVLSNDGTSLATAPTAKTAAVSTALAITNVTAGETLVAIDVRPQNQQLYALGVNATANTATLYCLSPQTGFAAVVGTASGIAFTDTVATPIDFPDPAIVGWDIDFNPAADRLRIVTTSLNFRVNPNTGGPVDFDNTPGNGTNPDGAINGGTTTVSATAYTNSQPNNGNITTQYTLDATTNSLFIQAPPNNGTQTLVTAVTLGGNPLDFSTQVGFDIPPGVNTAASNTPVTTGSGFALLTVGGVTSLYSINLPTGAATLVGSLSGRSFAIRQELGAAIAMNAAGTSLIRFNTATPGTTTTVAIDQAPLASGETLVGIDFRPQTGQFYALAVNHTANTGTLYLIDPQSGTPTLAVAGTQSAITFAGVDLPDPTLAGYGVDFNPTVDRLRVVTSSGLNFRINPITGLPAAATVDGAINGLSAGSTGVGATAYTNSFAQSLTGGVTTQYTLDAASNSLYIQNPPNNGTQTIPLPVTVGGAALDFTDVNGFDIPSAVRVTASAAAATGEGWLVATVGGVTGLYRVDLASGAVTSLGSIGAGTTPLAGLTVFTTPGLQVQDGANTILADNQDSIAFGEVIIGTPEVQLVTVTNTGSQPLIFAAATANGDFTVTAKPTGVVAPGGSVQVGVTLSATVAGSRADTLTITSNDAAVPSFEIALTGEALLALGADLATATTGDTRINPLANDGLDDTYFLFDVSDPAITIEGRTLIVPAGFTGTFTYRVTDGILEGQGTVTVIAGTAAVNPSTFTGLLFDAVDDVTGWATATISAAGVATVQVRGGTETVKTKVTFPTGVTVASSFTKLGNLTLTRNANGTVDVVLAALGGDLAGTLRAARTTATVQKHHIALASIDAGIPGGGYAIATVSNKGAVKLTGVLPDGLPFSAATNLGDNDSFAFYTVVIGGAKPPAVLGGELLAADLAATDVTGELLYAKLPQIAGAKGTHLGGFETILTANGSLYPAAAVLPAGAGTLTLSGAGLVTEISAVTVTAGVPSLPPASRAKAWTGVSPKKGTFAAKVLLPGATKPVSGSGLYLPKSNSARGYFPGATIGGRIELTVP